MVNIYTCTYQKDKKKFAKYDYCLSSLKLWYLELALMSIRYITSNKLGKTSLRVGLLWIGLIRTLFNCNGPKHSLTLPLASGTSFCRLPSSFHSSSWSAQATLFSRVSYGWLYSLSHGFNVPSKWFIPVKLSLNSLCIFIATNLLVLCFLVCNRSELARNV